MTEQKQKPDNRRNRRYDQIYFAVSLGLSVVFWVNKLTVDAIIMTLFCLSYMASLLLHLDQHPNTGVNRWRHIVFRLICLAGFATFTVMAFAGDMKLFQIVGLIGSTGALVPIVQTLWVIVKDWWGDGGNSPDAYR